MIVDVLIIEIEDINIDCTWTFIY